MGATFGLAKNGQKVLDELSPGLFQHMNDIGLQGPEHSAMVFIWWEMRDAFLKFVRERENIELICGEEFSTIQDKDDGIIVSFQSDLELVGDFLVGADGANSSVRSKVLGLPPNIVSDTTVYRGTVDVPKTASPELLECLNTGMVPFFSEKGESLYFVLFNFHKRYPGRLAWILVTKLDVHGDPSITPHTIIENTIENERDMNLLKEIFALSSKDHFKPFQKSSITDLSEPILEKFGGRWGGRGRITLIGDAAHAMKATDGYGGSMALEDSIVLSRILKESAKKNNTSIPDLLEQYESERLPRVKRVYDNQLERFQTRMQGRKLGPQSREFLEWLFAGI